MDIFGQLLEMDDEEDREFSKSIVWNYFDQAETTFGNMDDALWVVRVSFKVLCVDRREGRRVRSPVE